MALYLGGSSERRRRAELVASVAGIMYRVECSACNFDGEMPAEAYVAEQNDLGYSVCPKCGERKARSLGEAGSDPAQFQEEIDAISSVSEVQAALDIEEESLEKVILELAAQPQDPARAKALRRERIRLEAKIQALNMRWSRILAPDLDG